MSLAMIVKELNALVLIVKLIKIEKELTVPPRIVKTWDELPQLVQAQGETFSTRVLERQYRDLQSELTTLKAAVKEYLERPSVDGRSDRQQMRKHLEELSR